MDKNPKNPSMEVNTINTDVTENQVKSKISNSKSSEGNSYYLKYNESTDNDKKELQTELKLSTNGEVNLKKSDIEKLNQSKSLSIIKDETINSDVTDLSKVPSKTSNTHLIKSPNFQQHTNPTISSVQDTISASFAKQNESISQNIP